MNELVPGFIVSLKREIQGLEEAAKRADKLGETELAGDRRAQKQCLETYLKLAEKQEPK